jgi:hypothetical protein
MSRRALVANATTLCRMMPMLWKSLSVKLVTSRLVSVRAWHLLQRAFVLNSSQPRWAASSLAFLHETEVRHDSAFRDRRLQEA